MKLIQFNINLLKVFKNGMFRAVLNVLFFSDLMFYCYQILCFSRNAYKLFLFILTEALWMPPPHKFCVVYLHFTGYQMKA